MAPPKKKSIASRKRVLDLQASKSNSPPPRSSWQGKYNELLPEDEDLQSSSSEKISSTTKNALPGLVNDYNSDSDTDTALPIPQKIKKPIATVVRTDVEPVASSSKFSDTKMKKSASQYIVTGTSWTQCYDQNTGYPYYWNQLTNEVSWQPPPEYVAALQLMQKRQVIAAAVVAAASAATSASSKVQSTSKVTDKTKKDKKYPWGETSESDDEKIEMITSFGPQSDDESDIKAPAVPKKNKTRPRPKKTDNGPVVGPQLPPSTDENHDLYETSSLMAPLVADEGPPGAESPATNSTHIIPDSSEEGHRQTNGANAGSDSTASNDDDCSDNDDDVLSILKHKAKLLRKLGGKVPSPVREILNPDSADDCSARNDVKNNMDIENFEKPNEIDLADEILAEIEKEVPPDFPETVKSPNEVPTTSFALIASYGDDSDAEEVTEPVAKSNPKPLFPSTIRSETSPVSKPLFPAALDTGLLEVLSPRIGEAEIPLNKPLARLPSPPHLVDPELPDSTTAVKTFQRKKRIEIPAAHLEGSSSIKLSESDQTESQIPVPNANPQYNMDPAAGEHRGFGFSQLQPVSGFSVQKKTNAGGIQFIKAETINFKTPSPSTSFETSKTPKSDCSTTTTTALSQDIQDGAALLKEKLEFLGEGKDEVSAVQLMAIQLETLVSAWQSGSLTPEYLCQWLGGRAIELLQNEEAAAPPGWICEWDREKKLYSYRNIKTGNVTWSYPELVSDVPDEAAPATPEPEHASVMEEVEMEISDTPPRPSPSHHDPDPEMLREPTTPPPPPVLSRSVTPPPPPPPIIISKAEQVSSSSEEMAMPLDPPLPASPPPPPPVATYPPLPPDEPPPPGVDELDEILMRPPLPPTIWMPPPPPPPPDSSSQVVHVHENNVPSVSSSNGSEVSTSQQHSRKRSLVSELDSFYSDLAKLDSTEFATCNEAEISAPPSAVFGQPPLPRSPAPPAARVLSPPASSQQASSTQEPVVKKRKKSKITPGLTMKKKGVSSLVAKWEQVREEAKRNNSSDEDNDDVTSTHK